MGLLGTGILKGLGVTLKHFINTYAEDFKYIGAKAGVEARPLRRQNPKNHGMVTVEYPKERLPMPENFRYVPFLVEDTTKEEVKCTSCGICAKVCPPQCIWIVRTEDPVTKRPVPDPKDFFIDTTICMNCGYCAEFCPFDAIKMDHDYELSYYPQQREDARLIQDKQELLKPDTYHASIHPLDWQREMDAAAAEAAKKAPKPPATPAPAVEAAPVAKPAAPPPSSGAAKPLGGGASKPLGGGASKPLGGGASKPLGSGASKPLGGGAAKPTASVSAQPTSTSEPTDAPPVTEPPPTEAPKVLGGGAKKPLGAGAQRPPKP
jgi:NADH-quinone oxidoreductase subunit I